MNEQEIRLKYQRDGGSQGKNDIAVSRFIDMLHLHEKSDNPYIRRIVENVQNISSLAPNFTIFQSEKSTFFMHQFCALQIKLNSDDLVLCHEFGHAILGITEQRDETKNNSLRNSSHVNPPENFEEIVKQANQNAKSTKNIEKFKAYIKYLSDANQSERTDAEKGPVSDIISSIFQTPAFSIENKKHVLPSYHMRDYYFDEEKGQMKVDKIFDEDFANFYTLTVNNCDKELQILREFLGEEWMHVMETRLEEASKQMAKSIDRKEDVMGNIKSVIMGVDRSNIPGQIIEEVVEQKGKE